MGPAAAAAPRLRRWEDLPGPRGVPLLGNAAQLRQGVTHLQLERWAREYGPVYRLRLGRLRVTVVGDHALVAQVLRDRPDGFARTDRLREIGAEIGLPPGVFSSNGQTWRLQRRMVMAGFDPGHVKAYHPSLARVADALAVRWRRAARDGQAVDLQSDLMRFTVDAIAGLAFGSQVDTLGRDGDVIQQHLDQIFPALARRLFAPVPWWRIRRSAADRALEQAVREVMRAVHGFIAEARARLAVDPSRRTHPPNLLEAMVVAAAEPGSGIDDELLAGNVVTMLLAGEDTTANTLAWMIHLLWRHPQALARATDEVRRVVGGDRAPTLDELAALDYVEACAHETMRLKPVAPILPQQALRDTVLGDVLVGEGTVVVGLMRRDSVDEAHVPHAALFDPARWLEGGHTAGQVASSAKRIAMPFGAGPRICPGRYLALLEMKIAMATLLGRFDITAVDTPDGGEAAERLSFTMTPVGLTMRLRERV